MHAESLNNAAALLLINVDEAVLLWNIYLINEIEKSLQGKVAIYCVNDCLEKPCMLVFQLPFFLFYSFENYLFLLSCMSEDNC